MNFNVGGRFIGFNFFVTNGTWSRPSNCTSIIVIGIGGGGGGRGNSGVTPNGANGSATSFGSILSFGGGSGSTSESSDMNVGTSPDAFDLIRLGGAFGFPVHNLFGYGQGGRGVVRVASSFAQAKGGQGSSGFMGAKIIDDNLLDSYFVTIGTGGSGGNGDSATLSGSSGASGCLLVIMFGG